MNTYSNDQNVHVFETLERSHSLSRISPGWWWMFWPGDAYNFSLNDFICTGSGLE